MDDFRRGLKLLLDAHAVLWAVYEPERLSVRARETISDPQHELFVSLASVWELANKVAAFRLPFAGASVPAMIERIAGLGVTFLPVSVEDIVASAELPRHHADPFDRMLIAQSRTRSLILVTKDARISLYDVQLLWN